MSAQEFIHGQPGLRDDRAQGAARQIAGMTRHHRDFSRGAFDPEFVAAFAGTKIFKAVSAQVRDDIAILERWKTMAQAGIGRATGKERWKARDFFFSARLSSGGSGSFSVRYTSMSSRALACASSIVSARVRPCTTRPGRSVLVPRKPPSASGSIFTSRTISVSIARDVKPGRGNDKPETFA